MEKTLLNIKIDPALKGQAQDAAKELGLPLGTIINAYLRDFIHQKRVVFAAQPIPNVRTQKLLKKLAVDRAKAKNAYGPLSYEQAVAYLDAV